MKTVKIIDYFSGNIFSVKKAFEQFDCCVEFARRQEQLNDADYLVLPGVGAFGDGITNLKKQDLVEAIQGYVKSGKPLLGICLGMQLLFSVSEEFGFHHGLDIIPGRVKQLPLQSHIKLPNIGWSKLRPPEGKTLSYWQTSIFKGFPQEKDVYFVHSMAAYPENPNHCLSRTLYGDHWFCSSVWKENIIGCQFHPEKSGEGGLKIIQNFLKY